MTDGIGVMECPVGVVLGHEYAGKVVDVGTEVQHVGPGDRVTALATPGCGRCAACRAGDLLWCTAVPEDKVFASGAYAEYARTVGASVVPLPDGVEYEQGALVEPLSVALHGVRLAALLPGTAATVLGSGPIALATLAWLRAEGVDDVTVVATSTRREPYARAMGATNFVTVDPADLATYPEPAQTVFEAAGTPGSLAAAFGMARPKGTVVSFGFCDVQDGFIPALVLVKELRLQFSMMYDRAEFETTVDALRNGTVAADAMISKIVSLDALPAAFRGLHGPHAECKVLIDPWAQPTSTPRERDHSE